MRIPYALVVALTLAGTLAACNDDHHNRSGRSGADTSAVAAAPTLGPVYNAPVTAYRAGDFDPDAEDNTAARIDIGDLDTGDTGRVSLGNISADAFPLLLVAELDAQSSYYDESTLTEIAVPADLQGRMLHALVPAPTGDAPVAITPFTDIAYRAAVAQDLLPISADAAARVNNIVRDALPGTLDSLLTTPTVFDAGTTAGSLAADASGRHALLLAALAVLGEGRDAPALRVLADLLADLADDSQLNASTTINETYGPDLADRYQEAIEAIANAYGDAALQAEAATYAALKTQFDFSDVDNAPSDGGGTGGIGGEAGNADPSSTDLGSRMGATGIVDGATRTFTTSVMAVSGIAGKAQITALGDLPLKAWEFTIPPQTGSYDCESIEGALISYRYGNPLVGEPIVMYLASDAGSCSIKAYRKGRDFVGTFSATLIGEGSATHTVTSGGFRVILPADIAPEQGT